MLQKADLNIMAYRPVIEDRFVPQEYRERVSKASIPENVKDVLLRPINNSVAFLNHTDHGDFEVAMAFQSKGTQKYVRILDALYDMITSDQVYYLDELGEDLHYDLLFYYLSVFIFNSERSQLIITSQETTLLSQDLINENRGVVWFVEKTTVRLHRNIRVETLSACIGICRSITLIVQAVWGPNQSWAVFL